VKDFLTLVPSSQAKKPVALPIPGGSRQLTKNQKNKTYGSGNHIRYYGHDRRRRNRRSGGYRHLCCRDGRFGHQEICSGRQIIARGASTGISSWLVAVGAAWLLPSPAFSTEQETLDAILVELEAHAVLLTDLKSEVVTSVEVASIEQTANFQAFYNSAFICLAVVMFFTLLFHAIRASAK